MPGPIGDVSPEVPILIRSHEKASDTSSCYLISRDVKLCQRFSRGCSRSVENLGGGAFKLEGQPNMHTSIEIRDSNERQNVDPGKTED